MRTISELRAGGPADITANRELHMPGAERGAFLGILAFKMNHREAERRKYL